MQGAAVQQSQGEPEQLLPQVSPAWAEYMGVFIHLRLQWIIVADLCTDEISPSQRCPRNGPRVSMTSQGRKLYQEGAVPECASHSTEVVMEIENSGQMMRDISLDLVAWGCHPSYTEG